MSRPTTDSPPPVPRLDGAAGRLAAIGLAAVVLGAPIAEVGGALLNGERPRILAAADALWTRGDTQRETFERSLREESLVTRALLPSYQQLLVATFGADHRKVVSGQDGWLFLREDLDHACALSDFAVGHAGTAAVAAIVDLRDQLQQRGIELLVVPVPGKECADPGRFSPLAGDLASAANPGIDELFAQLDAKNLHFVRLDELFAERRAAALSGPLYLPQDTHWSPATMRAAAERIAANAIQILGERPEDDGRLTRSTAALKGEGDLVAMLALAAPKRLFPPMDLTIEPVLDATSKAPVVPDAGSDVLLLGDSFTRVFGDPALGLGAGGGLAEQLAFELKRPIDVIALPGGGATTTRAVLAQTAERLNCKQLVIWQWSLRDLAGPTELWRKIAIPDASAAALAMNDRLVVVGTIAEVTRVPESFGYAFCLATFEYRVDEVVEGTAGGERIWVAFPAIVDRQETVAQSFTIGTRHRLVLEPLAKYHSLNNTSWMDDTNLEGRLWFPVEWSAATAGGH